MIDFDGQINYSNLVKINLTQSNELSFYPNPFMHELNLVGEFPAEDNFNLKLINLLGQELYSIEIKDTNPKINLPAYLASGMYILKLSNELGVEMYRKVLKQ